MQILLLEEETMKTMRFTVEIDMPEGDWVSPEYIRELIQDDLDYADSDYGDNVGRTKVRVTEEQI